MDNLQLIKILYIEDNESDIVLLFDLLSSINTRIYNITNAKTLKEGLQYLECGPFDIILLDIKLPDAVNVQNSIIRIHAHAGNVPIIICTGLDNWDTVVIALQAGADDYMVKGEDTAKSIARRIVCSILRRGKTRNELLDEMKRTLAQMELIING